VAALAGVSTTTVSRTLNDPALVDPATARRVLEAVKIKAYYPNTHARSLVSGKSRMVGLIVSDITNPFFPEIVQGFEEAALSKGYDILIGSTGYDLGRMAHCVRRMLERKVDGVAIMTSEMDAHLVDQFSHREVRMVFLDVGQPGAGITNIVVDYAMGIGEAADHLFELGHRRIGFVSGPPQLKSAQIRRSAFLNKLRHYDLSEDFVVEGDHRVGGGLDAMHRLLSLVDPPTAVLASNDLTALGMMRAMRKARLRVPEDISIIGFDDIGLAEFTDPPLTTVRLPRRQIAECAFEAVVSDMHAAEWKNEYAIETHLVIRETTGRPSR
jgi:DNA-binding LacI/PurR family transcriptional regulator